jgi:hypothetical protein
VKQSLGGIQLGLFLWIKDCPVSSRVDGLPSKLYCRIIRVTGASWALPWRGLVFSPHVVVMLLGFNIQGAPGQGWSEEATLLGLAFN